MTAAYVVKLNCHKTYGAGRGVMPLENSIIYVYCCVQIFILKLSMFRSAAEVLSPRWQIARWLPWKSPVSFWGKVEIRGFGVFRESLAPVVSLFGIEGSLCQALLINTSRSPQEIGKNPDVRPGRTLMYFFRVAYIQLISKPFNGHNPLRIIRIFFYFFS